jgi:hypothetical protein
MVKRIKILITLVICNNMTESRWWFSPLKIDETGNELLPSAHKVHEKSEKLSNASAFSIDMRRFFVNKSYDKDEGLFRKHAPEKLKDIFHKAENTNDLLIVSSFQTGTAPIVQRIHYLKKGQKINQIIGDFYKTLVCSFSDFKDKHITLQTQVYDIDQYDDIKETVDSASSLAGNISVTFPVVAPYVAMGTSVVKGLTGLLDKLDEHESIIDSNLRLDVADDSTGYQVLQTGHWICFDEPQEEVLILKPNMDIYRKEPQGRDPFIDGSYAVYSIRKVDYQEPFWEIDQKIAKLLSELDGKGNSSRAPVDFLRDTMEGYTAFRKLQRYFELQTKGDKRTPEEEQLFNKLAQDTTIKPYLA